MNAKVQVQRVDLASKFPKFQTCGRSICGMRCTNKSGPWRSHLCCYDALVSDTTADLHRCCTVQAFMGQSCFGGKRGKVMLWLLWIFPGFSVSIWNFLLCVTDTADTVIDDVVVCYLKLHIVCIFSRPRSLLFRPNWQAKMLIKFPTEEVYSETMYHLLIIQHLSCSSKSHLIISASSLLLAASS